MGDHDQLSTVAVMPFRHGSVDVRLAVVGLMTTSGDQSPAHPISRSNAHQHSARDTEPNDVNPRIQGLQRQNRSHVVVELEPFLGDWVLLVTARGPVFWGLQCWLVLADDGLQRLACGIPAELTRSTLGADAHRRTTQTLFSTRISRACDRISADTESPPAARQRGGRRDDDGAPLPTPAASVRPRAPGTGDAPSRRDAVAWRRGRTGRVGGCCARPPTLTRSDHRVRVSAAMALPPTVPAGIPMDRHSRRRRTRIAARQRRSEQDAAWTPVRVRPLRRLRGRRRGRSRWPPTS